MRLYAETVRGQHNSESIAYHAMICARGVNRGPSTSTASKNTRKSIDEWLPKEAVRAIVARPASCYFSGIATMNQRTD